MMDPSKKRSFEDHWKEAFDEASIPPPASAWEGIEARLDHDISKQGFEDQWKKAFDDASVLPPASAWEGIEARLDQDDDVKIIPLWWRSSRLWFAAATVAALLVTGGLWLNRDMWDNSTRKTDVAVKTLPSEKKEVKSTDNVKEITEAIAAEKSIAATSSGSAPERSSRANALALGAGSRVVKDLRKESDNQKPDAGFNAGRTDQLGLHVKGKETERDEVATNQKAPDSGEMLLKPQTKAVAIASAQENIRDAQAGRPQITAEMLAAMPYKDLDVYFQKRYVFYKPKAEQEVPVIKKHQEYWAGVGLMPATFNPDVNLKTSPTSFATKSYSSQKSLTGKNDPGFSYAVQTQGGMRISKHWSVETGISYLQGNSNYEGGGYLIDAATSGSSNVLENALAEVANTQKGSAQPLYSADNSVYIDLTKQVRNDYRYLQLPVQAGFTLNPDGKLSYSVLGGMMANFFLNNELESGNGNVIKTTASDEVYRSINWSATTGVRFNYRLSAKWRASLTGSYQKAVTSGFLNNQNLESHPYLYGVSWGMRYSF